MFKIPLLDERGVSQLDILIFTKHMYTMTKAGITIVDALETMIEQTKSEVFQKVLRKVADDVTNGQSLAKAMSKHPNVFDTFYHSLISISEESGTLEKNLEFLTVQLAKRFALKRKIQSAMLYPSLIIISATVLGGFVSVMVLPQLIPFFDSFQLELPLSTRVVLAIAYLFRDYGILILVSLITALAAFLAAIRIPKIRLAWHTVLLHLPLIGGFLLSAQLAQLSRNWGILMASGLPTPRSIEITAQTLSNYRLRQHLLTLSLALQNGQGLAASIISLGISEFPPLITRMLGVGEKTGNLDDLLLYLGDFYEEDIDTQTKRLTTLIEPVLLLIIGLGVGFLALAIITPIYELSGSLRR